MAHRQDESQTQDWIEIGILSRCHGLKGGVFLRANDHRSEFGDYTRILVTTHDALREYKVKSSYVSAGQPVLVLDGIDSREAAEKLLQGRVAVSRDEIDADEDDVLVGDLIGLKVVAEGKGEIGEVVSVVDFGAQENVEIKLLNRKSTAIFPLLDEYVKEINLETGTITIVYVPEFLEDTV
jgi:16S rRNA processing protein RimM